MQWKKIWPLN